MTDPAFLAYLAGIFDGEGCLWMNRQHSQKNKIPVYVLSAGVAMCTPQPVKALHSQFGGSLTKEKRRTKGHRDVFRWVVNGQNVIPIVEQLGPWMLAKREQFEVVAEYLKTLGITRTHWRFTPEEKEYQASVWEKLRAFKRSTYPND